MTESDASQRKSMQMMNRLLMLLGFVSATAFGSGIVVALIDEAEVPPEQVEFFEKQVRPVLIERCFQCHSSDAEKVEGGLLVESRKALLAGGESGPAIVPGASDKSLLIQSIRYESREMPPKGKLRPEEIASLEKWVEMGAPWPADASTSEHVVMTADLPRDWDALRQNHWAFRPLAEESPPNVKDLTWPESDIDRFILSRLEVAGLKPAQRADRRVLVRRAYFDLTGLPPTPEEVHAFESDSQPDAFAKLVDRLLDSPHYGERWGRHWLDVARYSDGFGGFLDNQAQPHAWRYRDWVIAALNRDLPFNEFVRLQIAGDLIDGDNAAVATGFFALGPTYISDGGDPEATAQARSETLDDRVDTLSRGILGLTVSCARCHDHKFDPIPQLDYYSLAGIFQNTNVIEKPIALPLVIQQYDEAQHVIREREKLLEQRETELKKDETKLLSEQPQELATLRSELQKLKDAAPPKPDSVHAIADGGTADMHLAIRGNLLRPGSVAPRRFLRIVAGADPIRFTSGSGRLELAEAVVSSQNPLTARVFVNRVWMHHFGKGLVRTPGNFGALGEKPTHPELLDWLTSRFINQGWSIKELHRDIMNSAAYCMSSRYDEQNFKADGDNRLLWRMNSRRLNIEAWRDALLAVSGDLDLQLGGLPVDDINSARRTIYLQVSRNGDHFQADEFMRLFDFPAMRATVSERLPNTVPQQYLFMMNNGYMLRRAELFAARLGKESQTNEQRIERAYRLLFSRFPTVDEQQIGLEFLKEQKATENIVASDDRSRMERYLQVLLSSNEFMYIE